MGSWPTMSPSPMNGPSASYRCRFERQIPVEVIRTITSVGSLITGSGTVSTRTARLPCQVAACMITSVDSCDSSRSRGLFFEARAGKPAAHRVRQRRGHRGVRRAARSRRAGTAARAGPRPGGRPGGAAHHCGRRGLRGLSAARLSRLAPSVPLDRRDEFLLAHQRPAEDVQLLGRLVEVLLAGLGVHPAVRAKWMTLRLTRIAQKLATRRHRNNAPTHTH